MITAAEARGLAGRTIEEKVEAIGNRIKELALEGKRVLRTSYDYREDNDFWVNAGYSSTAEWKAACKMLRDAGYAVDFYYVEGSIAVDMYTIIKW